MSTENFQKIAIVLPCYNENETIIEFLDEINEVLECNKYSFLIVVVDDDSSDNTLSLLNNYSGLNDVIQYEVLSLPYNMGHQTAILQGLMFAKNQDVDYAIVIDSDGQDDPKEITNLLKFIKTDYHIINVIRGRRKENYFLKILYWLYKVTFKFIIGKPMNFGNYCLISRKILNTTTQTGFIHFAAHLSKQKVFSNTIISNRRKRLNGESKMNLDGLIHHAFKSFIEYAESFLMLFFKAFLILLFSIIILFSYIMYQKLFTDHALLGWTSTISVILINTSIMCFGFFVIGLILLNILGQKKKINKELYTLNRQN